MRQCNHCFAKKPALVRKWSYEVALKKRLVSLMQMVFGQESGFDLTKTLHFPLALGIVNSTMRPKPSSFKDSAALEYSASAMALAERLPCLKLR